MARHIFKNGLSKVTFIISPGFSIRNWFPFPVDVKVDNSPFLEIESGRILPILDGSQNPRILINFTTKGSEDISYQSTEIRIGTSGTDREDISDWTFRRSKLSNPSSKSECIMKQKIVWSKGTVQLQVFSPYWIMNSTGFDLHYKTISPIGTGDEEIQHLGID